jgi:hypothetical protein
MRVAVGTDETEVLDRVFQGAHAGHPLGRVDAGEPGEPIRITPHSVSHQCIRDVVAAGMSDTAHFGRDQQRVGDAGAVHPLKHVIERDAAIGCGIDLHLVLVERAPVGGADGGGLIGPDIDHTVDCGPQAHAAFPKIRCSTLSPTRMSSRAAVPAASSRVARTGKRPSMVARLCGTVFSAM